MKPGPEHECGVGLPRHPRPGVELGDKLGRDGGSRTAVGEEVSSPSLVLAVMSFWSQWGTYASALGGGPTQAQRHLQVGWQGGPVDPVPALRASPGSHPGVLDDWVSAQEFLREKSSWSFSRRWHS